MADDVTGAVRRTPRPGPSTGDHQTPETAAPGAPGATNTATPVSPDAGTATEALSPEAAEALAALRAKLAEDPDSVLFPGPECDPEAYAALPPCTACEGGGQDTHGTIWEAPLAVHFAGPPCEVAGRRRQLCMWCGHVLIDVQLVDGEKLARWPEGALIHVEDGVGSVWPYEPGDDLPVGCCALPDDDGPDFPPPVVTVELPPMPDDHAAANEPAEPVDPGCDACGRPRVPDHDASAPGPTVKHPYRARGGCAGAACPDGPCPCEPNVEPTGEVDRG